MDILSVQVQPNRLSSFAEHSISKLRTVLAASDVVQSVEVKNGGDSERYINVNFVTSNPKVLWQSLREELVRLGLQSASIVTCTGSEGWGNYLLLHHYDHQQPIDSFGAL